MGVILFLMRHGVADPYGSKPDEDRQLTESGRAALRAGGPIWRRLDIDPEVVLSSPRQRAMETAQLFLAAIASSAVPVADERLAPGALWPQVAEAIATHAGASSILLVGHEPDLSRIIAQLTGAASVKLREGGMCRVQFRGSPQPGEGELTLLLDPDLYVPS